MVDEVGGIERRHAREEQVVVDLEGVVTHVVAERTQLGAVDRVAAERGDRRAGLDRRGREHAHALGRGGAGLGDRR